MSVNTHIYLYSHLLEQEHDQKMIGDPLITRTRHSYRYGSIISPNQLSVCEPSKPLINTNILKLGIAMSYLGALWHEKWTEDGP